LVLVANVISRPIDVIRFLFQCGLSLKRAHDVLDRICAGAHIPVELRGDTGAIVGKLARLGVSARVLRMPDVDIKRVREAQNLSQPEFATLYGLEVDTLRNWEQGRNAPDRATVVLMKVIETDPDAVLRALTGESGSPQAPSRGKRALV
jgi:DNA-binding transcriptional regulator YiaG